MRTIGIPLCCALVAGALVRAQGQQPAPPAFKGGVSLVTVDVTVLDRDGKPVPGLTSNDFQVKLNGKTQPVRALTYLEARTVAPGSAPDPKAPVMPQMFPMAEVRGGDASTANESRVFVILVDDLSIPALGGKALFTAAQRFVTGLPAGDLVGFATSSGPGAVNPTRDRAPISAALAAVVGEYMDPRSIDRGTPAGKEAGPDQSLGISQSLDIDRGDHAAFEQAILNECYHGDTTLMPKVAVESIAVGNKCASDIQVQARRTAALTRQTTGRQVGAFQSVIGAMKGATGIKHLLLITEGVGITFDATSLQPVARAAAEAGIQLSVVVEEQGLSLSDTGRRDEGGGAQAVDRHGDVATASRGRRDVRDRRAHAGRHGGRRVLPRDRLGRSVLPADRGRVFGRLSPGRRAARRCHARQGLLAGGDREALGTDRADQQARHGDGAGCRRGVDHLCSRHRKPRPRKGSSPSTISCAPP